MDNVSFTYPFENVFKTFPQLPLFGDTSPCQLIKEKDAERRAFRRLGKPSRTTKLMPNKGIWGDSPSWTDGIEDAHALAASKPLRVTPSYCKTSEILPRKVSLRLFCGGTIPTGTTSARINQEHMPRKTNCIFVIGWRLPESPTLLQLEQFLGNLHRVQCCALKQLVTADPETEAIVKCAVFPDSAHGTVVFIADK